ncbi:hypothetical protein [Ruminococcus sp.]
MEPDGLKCRCGRHGCLETRVSMFALCDSHKGDIFQGKYPGAIRRNSR